jgi:hypothetical protein
MALRLAAGSGLQRGDRYAAPKALPRRPRGAREGLKHGTNAPRLPARSTVRRGADC